MGAEGGIEGSWQGILASQWVLDQCLDSVNWDANVLTNRHSDWKMERRAENYALDVVKWDKKLRRSALQKMEYCDKIEHYIQYS